MIKMMMMMMMICGEGKEVGRVMKISLSLSKIIYDSNSSILGFNAVGSCFKMFIMLFLLVPTSPRFSKSSVREL